MGVYGFYFRIEIICFGSNFYGAKFSRIGEMRYIVFPASLLILVLKQ